MSDYTSLRYSIAWRGYGPEPFWAASAGKARYAAFKALREAGVRVNFRDFLADVECLHLGPEYGDPRTPKYGVAP